MQSHYWKRIFENNRPTLGLALSGGGARGLAHIGVLRVLEREGIHVDFLAGTSIGGVIAAAYASGMNTYELEHKILSIAKKPNLMLRMFDPGLPNGGLIRGERLHELFVREFGDKTFADLRLPLAVVTVDLNSHKQIVLQEGSVALALRASTAVPALFAPVEVNNWRLVDGGVLNNIPIDVVRAMGADVVIAVNIGLSREGSVIQWIGNHRWVPDSISTTLEVIDETIYAMRKAEQETRLRQFPPDVFLTPELAMEANALAGYDRTSELIEGGVRAAEANLSEIKNLLRPRRRWFYGKFLLKANATSIP